ncbi:YtxH domain-containing protein [Archangium violaceum]|uniref:YtxH domain-containing protein n=1 Tax=Archangium violaceum TaxID=83451 RepID=UPI001EF47F65|nr:YtxH domain-containing protein [Archangium violaceum]
MRKVLWAVALGTLLAGTGCHRNTRERAEDTAEKAGDKVEDTAEKAGDKAEDAAETAGDKAEKAGDKIEDATDD